MRTFARTILTTLALVCVSRGSEQTPAAPRDRQPCSTTAHREFDFWIGEWEVRRRDGTLAGTNWIERIAGGCGLQETWAGARGHNGRSLNAFDASDGRWHQTWIGSDGMLLKLSGGLREGRMVPGG